MKSNIILAVIALSAAYVAAEPRPPGIGGALIGAGRGLARSRTFREGATQLGMSAAEQGISAHYQSKMMRQQSQLQQRDFESELEARERHGGMGGGRSRGGSRRFRQGLAMGGDVDTTQSAPSRRELETREPGMGGMRGMGGMGGMRGMRGMGGMGGISGMLGRLRGGHRHFRQGLAMGGNMAANMPPPGGDTDPSQASAPPARRELDDFELEARGEGHHHSSHRHFRGGMGGADMSTGEANARRSDIDDAYYY